MSDSDAPGPSFEEVVRKMLNTPPKPKKVDSGKPHKKPKPAGLRTS